MGHSNSVRVYEGEFVCLIDGFVSTKNPGIAMMEGAIDSKVKKMSVSSYEQVVPLPLKL